MTSNFKTGYWLVVSVLLAVVGSLTAFMLVVQLRWIFDTTPPSAPTGLSASAVYSSRINLFWSASTDTVGVAGYNIYRCQDSGCTPTAKVGVAKSLSYSDTTSLSPMTTYVYKIAAFDTAGNVSAQSKSAVATTQPWTTSLSGSQWSVLEIPLISATTYTNPYTDVTVTAVFTSPSGSETTVQGFSNGGNSFAVRFAPTAQGQWKYAISSSPSDAHLNVKGTIKVGAPVPGNHGFIRRDSSHPYSFVYDDGTRYFMMGQTYYGLVLNALDDGNWQTSVTESKKYGFTKVRFFLDPWATIDGVQLLQYNHPLVLPFLASIDTPNPTYWHKMDQVVSYLQSQGMAADIDLFVDNSGEPASYLSAWTGCSAQIDRYVRYAVARYAAYDNVIWDVSNEWNYTGQPQSAIDHLGSLVNSTDPYMFNGSAKRSLSVHQQTRIDFQSFGRSWPTHAIIQYGPRNRTTMFGDQWGNVGIRYNRRNDMPVVNDEYGYIDYVDPINTYSLSSDVQFTESRNTLRNVIWGIAMAGGYGSFGGDDTTEGRSNSSPILSADWIDQPGVYGDIKVFSHFMQSVAYWQMAPQDSWVLGSRVYAFGTAGNHLIYAATGATFAVDLPDGDACTLTRIDPRTGAATSLGTISGGPNSVSTPDDRDYAYQLTGDFCK